MELVCVRRWGWSEVWTYSGQDHNGHSCLRHSSHLLLTTLGTDSASWTSWDQSAEVWHVLVDTDIRQRGKHIFSIVWLFATCKMAAVSRDSLHREASACQAASPSFARCNIGRFVYFLSLNACYTRPNRWVQNKQILQHQVAAMCLQRCKWRRLDCCVRVRAGPAGG